MLSLSSKKEILKKVNLEIKTNKQIDRLINKCRDILMGDYKQYRGDYRGRGKHISYMLNNEINTLKYLLEYEAGNDAKKGGKIGDYLSFKNNAKNRDILIFLIEYLSIISK